ncbi:hypothetical protein [Suttonella indologenes]|uniref:Uncharacterized protein n=1 Tax=Suttonella indologenes TaxID=13276 RepID=A0A380MW58_9GAMM|nr:hypothetical protein [Suttonella indologenes]SUO96414.1 Uncharacterised protein [Suttonella indologenes]
MNYVNVEIPQENRVLYEVQYGFLKKFFNVRNLTIDEKEHSLLFLEKKERQDMYSDDLEKKYGEYLRRWFIFFFSDSLIRVETITPKAKFNKEQTYYFIVRNVELLNTSKFDKNIFINTFTKAMNVNRGSGIYLDPKASEYKFEIDFSEMSL